MPSVDVLYLGDIKNAPYGARTREELSLFTVQALKFLQDNGAESIVSAMHGNLYYSDTVLTPPDQSGNKVYYLTEQVVVGGFLPPADPVGFVGKA